MRAIAAVSLLAMLSWMGHADALLPAHRSKICHIEGWSIDPDPMGLRVRAGPSANARELGRLPSFVRDDDGDYGPIFAITGASNGWLQIADARDAFRPSDLPRRPIYPGRGWIYGALVRLNVQSSSGFEKPDIRSRKLIDGGRAWLTQIGKIDGVVDCDGAWAKIIYSIPSTKATIRGARSGKAWVTDTCSDQRTTCDMGGAR